MSGCAAASLSSVYLLETNSILDSSTYHFLPSPNWLWYFKRVFPGLSFAHTSIGKP